MDRLLPATCISHLGGGDGNPRQRGQITYYPPLILAILIFLRKVANYEGMPQILHDNHRNYLKLASLTRPEGNLEDVS